MPRRCGNCVCFHTPKCSFAYSAESVNPDPPKTVSTMKELLDHLYDFTSKPVAYRRIVSSWDIILPTDDACADWEER